jgi:hypothetical protein
MRAHALAVFEKWGADAPLFAVAQARKAAAWSRDDASDFRSIRTISTAVCHGNFLSFRL